MNPLPANTITHRSCPFCGNTEGTGHCDKHPGGPVPMVERVYVVVTSATRAVVEALSNYEGDCWDEREIANCACAAIEAIR